MASEKIRNEMEQRSYKARQADKKVIVKKAELEKAIEEQIQARNKWNEIVDIGYKSEERNS